MIRVCDAIMGSGKSQSAITYINEHPDKKFIYIAPYLDEADRIFNACPDAKFREPSGKIPEHRFSKLSHVRQLISEGRNIASTHKLFRMYTDDIVEMIKEQRYTLIVDEAVDILEESKFSAGDTQLLIDAGYVENVNGTWCRTDKRYVGGRLNDLFGMLECNNIVESRTGKNKLFYWALPSSIIKAFEDVFVLTYMFDGHDLKHYFDMNGISFTNIGIEKIGDTYRFSDKVGLMPDYVSTLSSKIHIFDNAKLNSIGEEKYSLSHEWFKRNSDDCVDKLRRHLYNYMHNYQKAASKDVMWATFKDQSSKLAVRGYARQHVCFTTSATNAYRDRTVLAYLVNVFANPSKKITFSNSGIKYDDDAFALSVMVQWIWRSAIRDGNEIWIYLPSKRMRELLEQWITSVEALYAEQNKQKNGGE